MNVAGWIGRVGGAAILFAVSACAPPNGGPSGTLPPSNAPAASRTSHQRVSIGHFADPYAVAVDQGCLSNCNVYVADPGARTVWLVKPNGSRYAFATTAMLGEAFDPQGVAVSPTDGSVLIADKKNVHTESVVWRIAGTSVTKVAGLNFRFGDSFRAMYARGVAVGPNGEVYVAMVQWTRLIATGFGTQCVGNCWLSGLAQTGGSYGVAVDSTQTVFVAGTVFKVILRGTPQSQSFSSFIKVGDPYGVAVTWTGGRVVIADPANKRVWEVRDGSLLDLGTFADPYGVAVDREGYAYVADAGAKQVYKIKL
ncbi:MAG TPA: hypothetical protein VK760_15405 [Candidatus Acidoferrales bacterium]|nr:hypothetical protein [Candidatus Acidoferrales bacterium]